VELTARGRILFQIVAPIMESLEELPREFDRLCAELPEEHITLVVNATLGLDFLASILRQFEEANPLVDVTLFTRSRPVDQVVSGVADFGVISLAKRDQWPELDCQELFQDKLVFIVPLGHPLTRRTRDVLRDASKYPFVMPSRGTRPFLEIDGVFQKRGLKLRTLLEVDVWSDVKKAVSAGMGISIIPSLALSPRDTNLAVVDASEFFPKRAYGMVTRRGHIPSRATEDLMSRIVRAFRPLLNPFKLFYSERISRIGSNLSRCSRGRASCSPRGSGRTKAVGTDGVGSIPTQGAGRCRGHSTGTWETGRVRGWSFGAWAVADQEQRARSARQVFEAVLAKDAQGVALKLPH